MLGGMTSNVCGSCACPQHPNIPSGDILLMRNWIFSSLPQFWEISAFSYTWKPQATWCRQILTSPLASHLPQESSDSQLGLEIQVLGTAVLFGEVLL